MCFLELFVEDFTSSCIPLLMSSLTHIVFLQETQNFWEIIYRKYIPTMLFSMAEITIFSCQANQ